jgi:hypothetical protein
MEGTQHAKSTILEQINKARTDFAEGRQDLAEKVSQKEETLSKDLTVFHQIEHLEAHLAQWTNHVQNLDGWFENLKGQRVGILSELSHDIRKELSGSMQTTGDYSGAISRAVERLGLLDAAEKYRKEIVTGLKSATEDVARNTLNGYLTEHAPVLKKYAVKK